MTYARLCCLGFRGYFFRPFSSHGVYCENSMDEMAIGRRPERPYVFID